MTIGEHVEFKSRARKFEGRIIELESNGKFLVVQNEIGTTIRMKASETRRLRPRAIPEGFQRLA